MGNYIRHPWAGQGIGDEDSRHHRQRQAQRPPGGLQEQHQATKGDHQVLGDRGSWPFRKLVIEQEQVGGRKGGCKRQYPVKPGNMGVVPPPHHRKGGKRQEGRKRQVDGAGLGGIENADIEDKRQWRGNPQLEQGPDQRNDKQQNGCRPCQRPAPGFRLQYFVDLRDVNVFGRGRVAVGHGAGSIGISRVRQKPPEA